MKLSKYVCANILSFLGLTALTTLLLFLFTYNYIQDEIFKMFIKYGPIYTLLIVSSILLLPVEILISNKLLKKYFLNFRIKNECKIHAYNVFFYIGIMLALLYLLIFSYLLILYWQYYI